MQPEPPPSRGAEDEGGSGILGRTVGAILGTGGDREAERTGEGEEPQPHPEPEVEEPAPVEPVQQVAEATYEPEAAPGNDRINLNEATFEELRDLGFSVTQATRVLTYRERENGFSSLDKLDDVPGMSGSFLREVKPKLDL